MEMEGGKINAVVKGVYTHRLCSLDTFGFFGLLGCLIFLFFIIKEEFGSSISTVGLKNCEKYNELLFCFDF